MPSVCDAFLEWNVSHVVFDSPVKARVHYKDQTCALYVWDETKQQWVLGIKSYYQRISNNNLLKV